MLKRTVLGTDGERLESSIRYDLKDRVTHRTNPAGAVMRYLYDRNDKLVKQITPYGYEPEGDEGAGTTYAYDSRGNRISHIHYGNGVETAYTYDGDGNICTLETKAGENMLLSFAYQYDGNGNRTAKVGTQAGAAMGGITAGNNALDISYSYDVRGQLLEERRNGASVCYAYDKAGNRIRKTDAQGKVRYFYNEKNQLLTEDGINEKKQFSYDRQGGIIEEKSPAGIRLFSYNSRHQQTKVETENGNVQENRYDAEGLRFELLENGRRTSFVYHNGELLHEEGREENQTSYHLGLGIDAFQRGQELSYYHRDEQLSTAFITSQSGAIKNSYQYDAFGAGIEATEQLSNRIRYTGQQYDDLTGQYYLRARYYNPILGRFMQEDTYWGDGLNLYAYCANNPVMYFDPSGYAKMPRCGKTGKTGEGVGNSNNSSDTSPLPVPDVTTASNGLDYQSNSKHTVGQSGNNWSAGIEPRNSLELFGNSVESSKKTGVRFTFDEETGILHRFFYGNNGIWHWSGSTNQGENSLTSQEVPIDIIRLFNLPRKGW